MTVDSAIIVAIISTITTVITFFGSKLVSSRVERAQESRDRGDAATKLSDAAAQQIKTYNEEIVAPMRARIDDLEKENKLLRDLLVSNQTKTDENRAAYDAQITALKRSYGIQIENLQLQIKNTARSLESQREQIAILIEQSESKDRTIRQMQVEIEHLQRENEHLKSQIEKLQSENDILKTRPAGVV